MKDGRCRPLRKTCLRALGKATGDGHAKKVVAVGAALGAGALAAKVVRDRLSVREDPRRFRLRDGEPVPDGIERIVCGQLDLSIERLDGHTEQDLGIAVHEVRNSFKRLRATVRLARDELGDDVYRRENIAFRDAGRWLAGTRDSQVVLETLDALIERYPGDAPRAGSLALGRRLRASTLPLNGPSRTAPRSPRCSPSCITPAAACPPAPETRRTRYPGSRLQADLPARSRRLPHSAPRAQQREPARGAQAREGPLVHGAGRQTGPHPTA
jgi:hypothetical protein